MQWWLCITHLYTPIWPTAIMYGIVLIHQTHAEKAYNPQRRALSIMFNIGKQESAIPMFSEMCILKCPDINVYLTSRFMFCYHHESVPGIFRGYFITNMDINHYHTIQSTYFHIPVVKSDLSKFSMRYRGGRYGVRYSQAWYWYMYVWNSVCEISLITCIWH